MYHDQIININKYIRMHLCIAIIIRSCLATYMYNNTGKILDELCMIISQVRYIAITTHLH